MLPARKDIPPLLHVAPLSGYCYKPALAMRLMGLPYLTRFVDIAKPRVDRPAQFRALARFDEVPVLEIDGLVICQSNLILEYLARRESRLHEGDESQRLKVREWLYWEAERIGLNLAHAVSARRFGGYLEPVIKWYGHRVTEDLRKLDAVLREHPFLVGETVTIADIACAAWFPFARELGMDVDGFAAVNAWWKRLEALPGFATPQEVFAETTA
ncbi:MAG: glutathione S-transferase family protein [Lysobacteraceae bacterium]